MYWMVEGDPHFPSTKIKLEMFIEKVEGTLRKTIQSKNVSLNYCKLIALLVFIMVIRRLPFFVSERR